MKTCNEDTLESYDNTNVYDGTEHKIGMWFDKPLYRNALFTTLGALSTIKKVDISSWNIARPIRINWVVGPNVSGNYDSPTYMGSGANSYINVYYCGNEKTMHLYTNNNGFVNNQISIIIDYTKTTDQ